MRSIRAYIFAALATLMGAGAVSAQDITNPSLPGGSTTQLQYNNAGVFGGISGWTTNGTTQIIGTGGTVTTSQPIISGSQTWNNAAIAFKGLEFNFTTTAFSPGTNSDGANYLNIKKSGVSQFQIGVGTGGNPYAFIIGAVGGSNGPGFFAAITADTESRAVFGVNVSSAAELSFGPGNAGRDWTLTRSGTATAALVGKIQTTPTTSGFISPGLFDSSLNNLGRISWTAIGGNPAFVAAASKGWTWYTNDGSVRALDISSTGVAHTIISTAYRGWSSTGDSSGTVDTTISRSAAGVVQIGTTAANALGSLQAATLALGGATIGSNALAVTGTVIFGGALTLSPIAINGNVTTVIGAGTNQFIAHDTSDRAGQGIIGYGNNAFGAQQAFLKTRATTTAASTIVQSGDQISIFDFWGSDGSVYRKAASIQVKVDGTPSSGDMPGRFEFYTTPDGSATPVLRWGIDNTGLLFAFGQTSSFPALKRSGTTIAIRLADDSADAPISASTATFSALANVASTSAVCYNTGTGVLTYNATVGTCTVSGAQFKNLGEVVAASQAQIGIDALRVMDWSYKPEYKLDNRPHVGLIADDVEKMDPRCVTYKDGQIQNYDDRCVLAYLVAVVQQQKREIGELKRR